MQSSSLASSSSSSSPSSSHWVCAQCEKSNVQMLSQCFRCGASKPFPPANNNNSQNTTNNTSHAKIRSAGSAGGEATHQQSPNLAGKKGEGSALGSIALSPLPPSHTPSTHNANRLHVGGYRAGGGFAVCTRSLDLTTTTSASPSEGPALLSRAAEEGCALTPNRGGGGEKSGTTSSEGGGSSGSLARLPNDDRRPSTTGGERVPPSNSSSEGTLRSKQCELESIRVQLAEAIAELAAHRDAIVRAGLEMDEATLGIAMAKLEGVRYTLELKRRKLATAKEDLAALTATNAKLEADRARLQDTVDTAKRIHASNTARIANITRSYATEVPTMNTMNTRHKQEWNDIGSALFDMQHVFTAALQSCQAPAIKELQRLQQLLAERNEELAAVRGDLACAIKERTNAIDALTKEKKKHRSAEAEMKDQEHHAEQITSAAKEYEEKLKTLKQRYAEDVSALTTTNSKLKQQWNDMGSALFDMQQVFADGIGVL